MNDNRKKTMRSFFFALSGLFFFMLKEEFFLILFASTLYTGHAYITFYRKELYDINYLILTFLVFSLFWNIKTTYLLFAIISSLIANEFE